jgi:hypothetical protein
LALSVLGSSIARKRKKQLKQLLKRKDKRLKELSQKAKQTDLVYPDAPSTGVYTKIYSNSGAFAVLKTDGDLGYPGVVSRSCFT